MSLDELEKWLDSKIENLKKRARVDWSLPSTYGMRQAYEEVRDKVRELKEKEVDET